MMTVYNSQLDAMVKPRTDEYVEYLIQHFNKIAPPYLPKAHHEQESYIRHKMDESKQWRLSTHAQVEKYIYLSLNYRAMNRYPLPPEVVKCLTAYGKTGAEKLDMLHIELVKSSKA